MCAKGVVPMIHMKKKCFWASLLAIVLMLISSFALADTGTVTASKLILREKADSTSKALQTLSQGTKIEILSKSGSWYKVSYGKYTGYVYASYITVSDKVETKDDTLQKGDKGTAVKQLQQRLKELGYYNASCDGSFGEVTVQAVKAFQKKNGLTQDGVAGPSTLKKINSSSAVKATSGTSSTTVNTTNDESLKKGSTGNAVKELQQRLKELGYYKSSCDGNFGDVTVSAVKAFQKKNGLTQDGVAGPSTLKKLNSSSAVAASTTVKEETKDDDEALKKGAKGTAVKELQQRLKELGYYNYGIDSSYGDRTVEAVKAFQKKNGLTQDGVAGASTLKKLNSSSAVPAKETDTKKEETKDDGSLRKGSKGDAVKAVQQRLKELGFYSSSCDGDYGDRTVTAVKAFQKKNGLTQDGVVGATTLKKLNSDSAINADVVYTKLTPICTIFATIVPITGDSIDTAQSKNPPIKQYGTIHNTIKFVKGESKDRFPK